MIRGCFLLVLFLVFWDGKIRHPTERSIRKRSHELRGEVKRGHNTVKKKPMHQLPCIVLHPSCRTSGLGESLSEERPDMITEDEVLLIRSSFACVDSALHSAART